MQYAVPTAQACGYGLIEQPKTTSIHPKAIAPEKKESDT